MEKSFGRGDEPVDHGADGSDDDGEGEEGDEGFEVEGSEKACKDLHNACDEVDFLVGEDEGDGKGSEAHGEEDEEGGGEDSFGEVFLGVSDVIHMDAGEFHAEKRGHDGDEGDPIGCIGKRGDHFGGCERNLERFPGEDPKDAE